MGEGKEITKEIYDSLKIGDSITCKDQKLKDITLGKEYTIEGFHDNRCSVLIIDDAGDRRQLDEYVVMGCFYLSNDKDIVEDNVNHPKHYTSHPSGIECIEITRHYCFSIGNAIKYLWRAGLKKDASLEDKQKEIEDLEKAIWYINDRIKQLKG